MCLSTLFYSFITGKSKKLKNSECLCINFVKKDNVVKIKRDYYLNKLIKSQNNKLVKIITGIRRCGKSCLLNTIFLNCLKK